jgi:hypothetical protein
MSALMRMVVRGVLWVAVVVSACFAATAWMTGQTHEALALTALTLSLASLLLAAYTAEARR